MYLSFVPARTRVVDLAEVQKWLIRSERNIVGWVLSRGVEDLCPTTTDYLTYGS